MRKKLVSLDLDGVLNTYNGGYLKDFIPPLKEGALKFLSELHKDFDIEIYTVRDVDLVKKWLEENNLTEFIKGITNEKNPFSSVFVDDRAVTFEGDYEKTLSAIKEFKPYWADNL